MAKGMRAAEHIPVWLFQLFEPPFNASELSSVKMVTHHIADGLDISADPAELANGHRKRFSIAGFAGKEIQGVGRAGEGVANLIGILCYFPPSCQI